MKQWYIEYFENSAQSYDKEVYTQGTVTETDFIEKEINYDKSKRILDVGCGTGRHAIELAKRGYTVTGVDISQCQLARAKTKAEEAGVQVELIHGDARELSFNNRFDMVIMLCEGGFSLMETDEMNFRILDGAARALKPNGKFIFTTLSVLYPLYHSVKDFLTEHGVQHSRDHNFDLLTFRESSEMEHTDDAGVKKLLKCNERYYAPSEITWLLKSLGFRDIGIFGCETGIFSREKALTSEHFEMLVTAEK